MGELELIRGVRRLAGGAGGAVRLGIGDDCAVLRPPAGRDVLVTTDFSLEGRHFRRDWHPAESVGHRCLARGLSDLAAMGARPMAAFLSLALPGGFMKKAAGQRWLDGFFAGFMGLAEATGTKLAGGDTAAAPGGEIVADVVLVGSAPRGKELRRSGAKAGDGLYVTGALGGSAVELKSLAEHPKRFARVAEKVVRSNGARGGAKEGLAKGYAQGVSEGKGVSSKRLLADAVALAMADVHPHLFPVPRLAVGEKLRGVASAAMDVSDGLSTDLRHLCEESGVGALVDACLLPRHVLVGDRRNGVDLALHGGEDYELLFTAAKGKRVPRSIAGVPVTRIGVVTRGPAISLVRRGREMPLVARGWEHGV